MGMNIDVSDKSSRRGTFCIVTGEVWHRTFYRETNSKHIKQSV